MVDRASIGAKGEPFELVIERGKVREFARAVRSADARYLRAEAPPVPPTFLTTMFFWEREVNGSNPWDRVKLDQERGMHAEQEYVFHGPPPRAGTKLTCQSRIEDVYEKEGRRGGKLGFAVMVTEFRDESGKLVAEAKMTGVETAAVPPGTHSPPPEVGGRPGGGQTSGARVEPHVLEHALEPRALSPLVLGPLTRTDFVRYQGASGDMNPIHHDETVARAAGYQAPLAVGMFHAGAMAAHAASWLGPENVRRTRIRWKEQVWPGDVLTITGAVTRTYEEGGEKRVDVELACARQTEGVAVQGWMTFAIDADRVN